MSARYEVVIYQSNDHANRLPVTVTADNATEARQKALALAPNIHSPVVRFASVTETCDEADRGGTTTKRPPPPPPPYQPGNYSGRVE